MLFSVDNIYREKKTVIVISVIGKAIEAAANINRQAF